MTDTGTSIIYFEILLLTNLFCFYTKNNVKKNRILFKILLNIQ